MSLGIILVSLHPITVFGVISSTEQRHVEFGQSTSVRFGQSKPLQGTYDHLSVILASGHLEGRLRAVAAVDLAVNACSRKGASPGAAAAALASGGSHGDFGNVFL